MFLDPEIRVEIDNLTCNEIERLQKISPESDILFPSGKIVEEISHMNSQIVRRHLNQGGNVDFAYNIPWMTQVALKKGVNEKDVRIDDSNQTLYEAEPNRYLPLSKSSSVNLLVTLMPDEWIFNWFVRNIDQVCEVFEQMRYAIESGEDILILSNHATWFNLPLIAHCLHRIFGVPQKNIYTILGPAITHSHWNLSGILRYSNAIKTYPNTEKASTGYPESKRIQQNFFTKISEVFESKSFIKQSRIILLSPSGTTDRINLDGKIEMTKPTSGTETLIKLLVRRMGLLGFAIGINDTTIIPSGYSRPQRGEVFARILPVDHTDWKQKLPSTVLNEGGKIIGEWDIS
ncbi:hypothetical protein HOO68_02080 [Candidatus Gracilibacteria bacterium]|nr:hypothetical protein [Candidatus Gracilibacteria bacterium]